MITGHDIIYISSIEWTFLWQVHQEIALRLARAGNRVLYIENTGVRSPGLRDAGRIASRLKRWTKSLTSRGARAVAPNVYVCSPLVLPPFGSRIQRGINRRLLLPLIRRTARSLKMSDVLVWSYLPTDSARDVVKLFRGPGSTVVYYCLADFPSLSPNSKEMMESEVSLTQLSDVVFTNCAKLSERLAHWTNDVHIFPPGVDLAAFPPEAQAPPGAGASRPQVENAPAPNPETLHLRDRDPDREKLKSLPRPIIGYVGGLHKHVDFDMLAEMAASRPEWSWVFVGPFQAPVEKLQALPNIHLLGLKPHDELVHYLRDFDVCTVPYVKSAYTETVVPAKLNEYLAVGKPIVATNLPTICEFNEQHNVLITTENRAAQFLRAIEQALRLPKDWETIKRRREVAALCDWNTQLEAMSKLIEADLEERRF